MSEGATGALSQGEAADESETSETQFASVLSILRGASIYGIGTVIARGLGFVLTMLLTHGLGSAAFGVFVLAKRLVRISVGLADLGADKAIFRFVPKYEDDPVRRGSVLGLGLATSLVASLAFAAGLALAAPWINAQTIEHPLFPDVLRVFALALPLYTLRRVLTAVFRGIERLEYTVGINRIAFPSAKIAAVAGAFFLGASAVGVVAALVATGAVMLVATVVLLLARTDIRPRADGVRSVGREYYNYSLPLSVSAAGGLVYSHVDVLMLSVFTTATDIGVYHVALALASLLSLPLLATNQLFPPIASRLYEDGNYEDLQGIFGFITRWMVTISLFAGVALVLFRRPVLALFGADFTAGATVLVVLAFAKVVHAAVGPSGYVLMMTDHQYVSVANQVSTAALNTVLNYVFILQYGLVGAAVGTALSITVVNVARIAQVYYLEGLMPYSRRYVKPLVAVGVASAAMVGVRAGLAGRLPGLAIVLLGGLVGFGALAGTIWALGIDDTDREFLDRILEGTGQ